MNEENLHRNIDKIVDHIGMDYLAALSDDIVSQAEYDKLEFDEIPSPILVRSIIEYALYELLCTRKIVLIKIDKSGETDE